jgi:hypothetical protein
MEDLPRNPFEVHVPAGTRINQRSALALLTAILDALQKDQPKGQ